MCLVPVWSHPYHTLHECVQDKDPVAGSDGDALAVEGEVLRFDSTQAEPRKGDNGVVVRLLGHEVARNHDVAFVYHNEIAAVW